MEVIDLDQKRDLALNELTKFVSSSRHLATSAPSNSHRGPCDKIINFIYLSILVVKIKESVQMFLFGCEFLPRSSLSIVLMKLSESYSL